jgi:hypothetical protein
LGRCGCVKFVRRSSEHSDPLLARENANAVVFATRKTKTNMKAKYLSVIGLIGIAILGVCCKSGGDHASKRISAADKAAIKEIFKGANAKNYRIWFDGGKDTMGLKKLTLADIKQGGTTGVGTGAFLVDDDIGMCWRGTVPFDVFQGQLGVQRMQRLNAIMTRYQ